MEKPTPVVYLLHGEDDYAIAQFVSNFEQKLGDPSLAAMNITRLDGRSLNLEELPSVATAMPFLTRRRMVVIQNATARLEKEEARKKFLSLLDHLPPTTALILVEDHVLTNDRDRRNKRVHWLENWALNAEGRAFVQAFPAKKGADLVRWIQNQAKAAGGQIAPDAAQQLAVFVGDETRLADGEIQKLLAYVNYQRPVTLEDVLSLTVDRTEGNVFALVEAIGAQDQRRSMGMLHLLLEEQEPLMLLAMIVRHFRQLLLTREALDSGQAQDLPQILGVQPFVVEKLVPQARKFPMQDLEGIYRGLLDVDEAIKTGQMEALTALDSLVASLTLAA